MKKFLLLSFILLGTLLASLQTWALSISKIKGNKVILNLQGQKVSSGQQFQLVDAKNNNVGVLKIVSIKKDLALAQLVSGKVSGKEKLVAMAPVAASGAAAGAKVKTPPVAVAAVKEKTPEPPKPEEPRVPYRASFLLGLASNTLSLKVSDGQISQNVDNTGNSIGLAVAVDRQYFKPWFKFRGLLSYEQFNAIGAATINGCANKTSKDCKTDIKYLSLGGYAKYEKEYNIFRIWTAVGLNGKLPLSKSSTALDESSLGSTVAYGLTLGADYVLETKNFVSFSIEKQFFLKSDSAETNSLIIRIGAGKEF